MMDIFGYIAMLLVGLLLGSIGSGGSMFSVPILVYLFALDIETASAYSLFVVGTTSLTGAALKHKERLVSLSAGLLFGLPSVIATFIARRWILGLLPEQIGSTATVLIRKEDLLLVLFSVLMIGSGLAVLRRRVSALVPGESRRVFHLIVSGLVVGMIAGLAGAGGGFLILPALLFFARLPFPLAVGTTLMVIACNCLLGFCGDVFNQSIDWTFLVSVTALALAGLIVGLRSGGTVVGRFASREVFAWLTTGLGVIILVGQICC